MSTISGAMISANSVGLNACGTPSITALGGMICACDAWSMQPSSASCGAVLTRPSISPVTPNSTWYCSLSPPRPSIIQNAPPVAATAATDRFRNST